jgi:hypothetical protein
LVNETAFMISVTLAERSLARIRSTLRSAMLSKVVSPNLLDLGRAQAVDLQQLDALHCREVGGGPQLGHLEGTRRPKHAQDLPGFFGQVGDRDQASGVDAAEGGTDIDMPDVVLRNVLNGSAELDCDTHSSCTLRDQHLR